MSVQKKSLIGSRPAEKKATKTTKGTKVIGESKPLAASALRIAHLRVAHLRVSHLKRKA